LNRGGGVLLLVLAAACGGGGPDLLETDTIRRLRALAAAQEEGRAALRSDADGDGRGEYLPWTALVAGNPPLLPPDGFRVVERGVIHRERGGGLLYRVYLPAKAGGGAVDGVGGSGPDAPLDADGAETAWIAYAWPRGGRGHVYAVGPGGRVVRSSNADLRYSAGDRTPAWNAALVRGAPGGWSAPLAVGTLGGDGARWEAVE
jgi:hypothetical protein